MRAVLVAAAIGAAGWAVPVAARAGPPLAWRLVEIDVEGGRRLVLERDPPPRLEVRLSRERATAGEVVEAEIRLSGGEGRRRIEVRPSRPDVSILGPAEFEVEGAQRVVVRFTGASPGRGGIVVLERE